VRRTVPPSAEIEEQIDRLLAVGVGENPRESLSELAKLGARLIIQRAAEDEFDAWLGRARYERRPEAPPGLRNGFRPRRVQSGDCCNRPTRCQKQRPTHQFLDIDGMCRARESVLARV
jgi:hypothetical protein